MTAEGRFHRAIPAVIDRRYRRREGIDTPGFAGKEVAALTP